MALPAEVDVHSASDLVRTGALVIDVREAFELAEARLPDALHIPMRDFVARLSEVPRDRPVLLLCHSGGRSARVTAYLRAQGWENVANIAGGIVAWADEIDPSVAQP